jgi:hypothetical protein
LASEEYTRGSNKIKQHFGVEEWLKVLLLSQLLLLLV